MSWISPTNTLHFSLHYSFTLLLVAPSPMPSRCTSYRRIRRHKPSPKRPRPTRNGPRRTKSFCFLAITSSNLRKPRPSFSLFGICSPRATATTSASAEKKFWRSRNSKSSAVVCMYTFTRLCYRSSFWFKSLSSYPKTCISSDPPNPKNLGQWVRLRIGRRSTRVERTSPS